MGWWPCGGCGSCCQTVTITIPDPTDSDCGTCSNGGVGSGGGVDFDSEGASYDGTTWDCYYVADMGLGNFGVTGWDCGNCVSDPETYYGGVRLYVKNGRLILRLGINYITAAGCGGLGTGSTVWVDFDSDDHTLTTMTPMACDSSTVYTLELDSQVSVVIEGTEVCTWEVGDQFTFVGSPT